MQAELTRGLTGRPRWWVLRSSALVGRGPQAAGQVPRPANRQGSARLTGGAAAGAATGWLGAPAGGLAGWLGALAAPAGWLGALAAPAGWLGALAALAAGHFGSAGRKDGAPMAVGGGWV